jgi:CheY-like chemotaxis protein
VQKGCSTQLIMNPEQQIVPFNVLLAEDDKDDSFFFDKALQEISISTKLTTVYDGEELMMYLSENMEQLPDVLFLDINMPRKNGIECITEIRQSKKLKHLFVVVFSTFYSRYIDYEHEMIKKIKEIGVDDFIRKPHDYGQLKQIIHKVLLRGIDKKALKEQTNLI